MKRNLSKKTVTLLVSLMVLAGAAIGGTIAWLTDSTDELVNTFKAGKVTTTVTEELDEDTKKNVAITNTGDIDAYIRAAVVVTWKNSDGKICGQKPVEGRDYEIVWTMDNWVKGADGFYYFKEPVAPGADTDILFTDCKPKVEAPEEGYTLNVEIIGSGIQSDPAEVVETMWGGENNDEVNITVNPDKTLTVTAKAGG